MLISWTVPKLFYGTYGDIALTICSLLSMSSFIVVFQSGLVGATTGVPLLAQMFVITWARYLNMMKRVTALKMRALSNKLVFKHAPTGTLIQQRQKNTIDRNSFNGLCSYISEYPQLSTMYFRFKRIWKKHATAKN